MERAAASQTTRNTTMLFDTGHWLLAVSTERSGVQLIDHACCCLFFKIRGEETQPMKQMMCWVYFQHAAPVQGPNGAVFS